MIKESMEGNWFVEQEAVEAGSLPDCKYLWIMSYQLTAFESRVSGL